MTTVTIQPKAAPVRRKTTSFPLRDGISENRAMRIVTILRMCGFASWLEQTSLNASPSLVTEASLEQICIHCGPVLSFLK